MSRARGAPDEPPGETARGSGKRFVRRDPDPEPALSEHELEAMEGEVLPDREAMSVLDASVSIPLNPSVAADVLSGDAELADDAADAREPDR